MAADSGDIVDRVAQLQEDFRALSLMVTGCEAATSAAASMELRIFREVLALGRRLLEVFFMARAVSRPAVPVAPDGTPLSECHRRPTTYLSVFGKITFPRHRFFAPGQAGVSPLDAELSLPERCYSPLLRDWAGHEVVDAAYDPSDRTLEHILGLDLAKSALETLVEEDAVDVDAFYAQKPVPTAAEEGPILVVQADGAGVRLVGTEPSERTGHQTSKREAVVTTIYSIQRHVRTAQAVVDALLRDAGQGNTPRPRVVRPAPIGKETRATLDGKSAAFARLRERVEHRDGPHVQERAAQALHGGWLSKDCRVYVRRQLETLLAGQTQAVIDDLTTRLDAARLPSYRRKPVDDAIRYFTNHASSMRYDLYLARGWPIASGAIDGACKHVVRGRMDCSGMKWARPGANAMLKLRIVRINDDWDDYQRFHCQQEHLRLYGTSSHPGPIEAQALALAA